jgi:hypothetical protein
MDREKDLQLKKVFIGKGYYRGHGEETFDFMSQLWSDGFGSDRSLTIPEPVAWLPELSLLLQGRAPGKSLYSYMDNPLTGVDHARLAGRWLAKLHGSVVETAPQFGREEEETKIRKYTAVLAEARPEFADDFQALGKNILHSLEDINFAEQVPTHGDYQPKNIYILGRKATVIDFDRFAFAPAARDVGHFIGQCMTMSYVRTGGFDVIKAWNDGFLEEYNRASAPKVLRGLPFFIARTFVEVLYYKLFVRPVKDPYFVPHWLEECERWLASPSAGGVQ